MTVKTKRVNKSKPEILDEMARAAKVNRFKDMGRRLFPMLTTDTIYDAQTALEAVSGYIKYELAVREAGYKVTDLIVDFSKEPDTKITQVMKTIHDELKEENAKDSAEFLELFARTFSSFGTQEFLKKPMSDISVDQIIAS